MAIERAMALVTELLTQAQALAAVTARMRLDELGVSGEPAQREQLDRVVEKLGAAEHLEDLTPDERAIVVAFARSYMRQALDLIDEPERVGSWSHTDATLLQAQGKASAAVASLALEAGVGKPDARILDIGTGVAGLAIAFSSVFPASTVVGIDPWEPSLELARQNVADAGLDSRIMLRAATVEAFDDPDGFDLVWLPSFFIPERVMDEALRTVRRVLRPGGEVMVGVLDGPDDSLAGIIDALVTVRSGGALLTPADAVARLQRAGFAEAREVERTWKAPLRLAVGRRGE
ncbi:MAG TPA: class I SAM-dependent methyltransferase [Dehalococcoidia bacterium]|nr:class I SAM-dependent methyltransferase [Dehalococcoidia bacterium]